MKTITLDDDAYERLRTWKRTLRESFSTVVKNVIPTRGTLGAFLGFVETHWADEMPGYQVLEETVEARTVTKQNPWN